MSQRKKDIDCGLIGCTMKGFWIETTAEGEKLVRTISRHEGQKHVSTLKLAETVVRLMKEDERFAEYFKMLADL